MNFPIDVLYLDGRHCVVRMEENLRPWRVAKVSLQTASVLVGAAVLSVLLFPTIAGQLLHQRQSRSE